MLHQVYATLVDKFVSSDEKFTNPDTLVENILFMRLFMESLSVQPCNPTCEYEHLML